MVKQSGRIEPGYRMRQLIAGFLITVGLLGMIAVDSYACWTVALQECFERPVTQWPWVNPVGGTARWRNCALMGGQMVCWPSLPPTQPLRWGIQSQMYDQRICGNDQQAAWIIGQPTSEDPRYDPYPPNIDTYMIYGPVNLSSVVAAHVLFFYYNRSEPSHDSLYWGAATDFNLTPANMQVAESNWGRMVGLDFQETTMDLSNLRNYSTGDSVSMIGESTVYVFWRFKADGNANPAPPQGDIGAFVDQVIFAYDDGGIDLRSGALRLMRTDSSDFPVEPQLGDSVWASFDWQTCDGGVEEYPDFQVIGTVNELVVLDTVLSQVQPDTRITLYTDFWVNSAPGDYHVRIKLDTLGQVGETNENNNAANASYYVPPPNPAPVFTWVDPATDTLFADSIALLRWTCFDPDETALISIYYDQDQIGCIGVTIPGGSNRPELDGPDSLAWDVHALPQYRTMYVYAVVTDAQNQACIYGPFPVTIDHVRAANEPRGGLPTALTLGRNYPNPFNPVTTIEYSIPVSGPVTLRVFDIAGRTVATLVNEPLAPGNYRVEFNGRGQASGIYLYSLSTPGATLTSKMVLLK
ncbi:T9SS type A sorting domain-containing protein [candidate division KSB1 bacterium]|nr:T9SS type A sorting domain-containing protein [candidate division KSB1 bacterium]